MNINDGTIRSAEQVSLLSELERESYRPMLLDPTPHQRATGKVGRNHPCPCGSKKKFKSCCLQKTESDRAASKRAR